MVRPPILLAVAACLHAELRAEEPVVNKSEPPFQDFVVGKTKVRVAPQFGCNVTSFEHAGVEYLLQPRDPKATPGFMAGVPVMYPMPNRVRAGKFVFEGKTYSFPPNNGPNFIHGLAHSVPWEFLGKTNAADHVVRHFRLTFKPGTAWFEAFPHPHTLKLDVRVSDGAVRWEYTVDNGMGDKPVPFGFGIHPWFNYLDTRGDLHLTLPADRLMEAVDALPTGKLLPVAGTPKDLRTGRSLEGLIADDVYFGVDCTKPTVIDYKKRKTKLSLSASKEFAHAVVYTPKDQPYFCVENQTCSTDAHNLYAQGLKRESGLIVVPPGKTHSGQVEFRVQGY